MTLVACLIGSLALPVWSADDLFSSELMDQAYQWQQKNRDDLAAELWQVLLRADPKHAKALINLAAIEVRAGNFLAADALYRRARRLKPPPSDLNTLASLLEQAKRTHGQRIGISTPLHAPARTVRKKPDNGMVTPARSHPENNLPSESDTDGLLLKASPSLDSLH